MLRRMTLLFALIGLSWGQSNAGAALPTHAPTCVIVKHASTAHQMFVSGANWQFVSGDFPAGMKWKSNIPDRTIRKIKEMGGRVVIVAQTYTSADLDAAKKRCSDSQ